MAFWQADDGTLIYYDTYGDDKAGDTLLLLPGLLGSVNLHWQNFIRELQVDYHLVLVDWRGHGRSENKELDLLPKQLVHDLSGLLEHIGIGTVHIAGYDLGGYLGLMFALRHPNWVRTLLMQATKFYWNPAPVREVTRQLNPDLIIEKTPAYANRLAKEHGAARWRPLVRQAADLVAYLGEDGLTETMLTSVQCPVLVSVGDRDELVPVQEAYLLSRAFPDASLLVLPNVRHPFQSIKPSPFIPAMQGFHK